jgi:tetratricopeptide (TPR) repeat protein
MPFELEKEALRASGVRNSSHLSSCRGKLDSLYQEFLINAPISLIKATYTAKSLFEWLWKVKPSRYEFGGHFRLNEVIIAQISEDNASVGNCLGLTLLYNCLLSRMGLNSEALFLEDAFGKGPHVLTVLHIEHYTIDIENSLPEGFNYRGHYDNPSRIIWGNKELVADIYNSAGNQFFEETKFMKALESYETAIRLNPNYERAHINRALLLEKMGTRKI